MRKARSALLWAFYFGFITHTIGADYHEPIDYLSLSGVISVFIIFSIICGLSYSFAYFLPIKATISFVLICNVGFFLTAFHDGYISQNGYYNQLPKYATLYLFICIICNTPYFYGLYKRNSKK